MLPVASVGHVPLAAGILGAEPLVVTVPLLLPDTEPPSCVVPLELPLYDPELDVELEPELVLVTKEPLLLVSVPLLDPFAPFELPPELPPGEPLLLELLELVPPFDEPLGSWPKGVWGALVPQLTATAAADTNARVV